MAVRRADHRVAALESGQILITGGRTDATFLRSAEIFDPLLFMRPEDLYAFYQEFANLTLENEQLWQMYNNATNVIYGLAVTNATLQAELTYANETIGELETQLDVLQPNPFRLLPSIIPPRSRPHIFSLPDGRILTQAGTGDPSAQFRSVSVFNPKTETSYLAGGINDVRTGHTGNLLPDGRILFSGGSVRLTSGVTVITNSTEIYNVGISNSVPGPAMVRARTDGFSATLADGRVLVMGGRDTTTNFIAQSEIYEPSSNSFRLSGVMTNRIIFPSVTRLQDGRVLILGSSTNGTPVVYLFDPGTETFRSVGGASIGRFAHQATLLSDGKVLISGGRVGGSVTTVLSTTEIFDPVTETFTAGPNMLTGRLSFTATVLQDGTVLMAGGQTNVSSAFPGTVQAEIYHPSTGSFSPAGVMVTNQFLHAAALLNNGAVILIGGAPGIIGSATIRAQIYDPMHHVPTSQFGNLNLLIDDLESENADLATQLTSLQAALANANTTIAGLVVTNAQLQADLEACHAEKAALIGQINALTSQVAQQQGTINTLTAQNHALTNQVAQLQATISSLQAQNNALTNQVATLTQQNAQLQTALTAEQAQTAALTAQVAQQAALIAALQSQNGTLTNQVATLTAQNTALQTALTTTQGHVQTLVTAFQGEFNNPTFVIPGATLEQQVQNLINAILGLNHGQQQALYGQLD
ncbi:MAG: hypothetical protein K0Q55_166 [Verrucomicrobia bacterium]|nr:hypothetical protein [Verrucomicrobiota bacterium]